MQFKTAFATTERGAFAVSFIDVPTFRAFLRGVPGVYEKHMLSEGLSLVPKELLKLVKRPVVELLIELLASSLLDSDLAQVFESKHRKIRVRDLFRYAVIHVSHKPSFLARKTLELVSSRLGAFRLQLFTKVSIFSSCILDLLRVVKRVIGADCDVHDTAINPENLELGYRVWIIMLQRHVQIERVSSSIVGYRRRLYLPSKIVSIVLRYKERCFDSSFDGRDRGYTVNEVHVDHPLVVPHCSERSSFWERSALAGLQSFASAISGTLDKGRRKIRNALTDKLVGSVMVIDLVPRLVLESPFGGFIERVGVSSHRFDESNSVLILQPKLEINRSKHIHIVGGQMINSFRHNGRGTLLPGLKTGVSATPAPQVTL